MGNLWRSIEAEIKTPLISLLVSAITLGIAVNAGTDVLVEWLGTAWTIVLAMVTTVGIVFLAKPIRLLGRVIRDLFRANVVEISGPVQGHRGLIVLASTGLGISSAEGAIRHHYGTGRLEHCWLLTGGPGSEKSAAGLIGKCIDAGMQMSYFHPVPLFPVDADNPESVYHRINEIYEQAAEAGLREEEIIGDYTGGTKSMTAGMILACTSPRRHLQFMKPRRYTPDGRAEPGTESDPVAIDIGFELTSLTRPTGLRHGGKRIGFPGNRKV